MNDEYLWQKTGEDPEIERLENALAVFRYREALAAVPVVSAAEERTRRWPISLAFAFASVVAVAIMAAGWYLISRETINSGVTQEVASLPESTSTVFMEDQKQAGDLAEKKIVRNERRPKISFKRASFHRRTKPKDPTPTDILAALTAEERYAYRQLMLALSITGSKLKIVQDTIDGNEDTEDNKNHR
jgi:hypothetical protein